MFLANIMKMIAPETPSFKQSNEPTKCYQIAKKKVQKTFIFFFLFA